MTEGTYNLYLIAVHKDHQGQGIGAEIMSHIEELLRKSGHRILIVKLQVCRSLSLPESFTINVVTSERRLSGIFIRKEKIR